MGLDFRHLVRICKSFLFSSKSNLKSDCGSIVVFWFDSCRVNRANSQIVGKYNV